jgi:uncharacterized membrane protein YdjX (TVP38/TMEM64 family)
MPRTGQSDATHSMSKLVRVTAVIAVALLIPFIPFLLLEESIEALVSRWISSPPSRPTVFVLVVAILATDVFLPIPSSLVSTAAGTQLSVGVATLASWLGMTAGAVLGFAAARAFGRPLAVRLSSQHDLAALDRWSEKFGPWILVLFRALPVLAEASVLLLGTTRLAWWRFLTPVALANLGIAAAYSWLGFFGQTQNMTAYVLAGSIALPVLAAAIVRWRAIARTPHGLHV